MSTSVAVEVAEHPTMPGRNGGTLHRGNRGVRSVLVVLQDMARNRLRKAIELAGDILEDDERNVEDQMRAAEFLRRCTGMDRERARPPKRTSFGVARAPATELARTATAATAPAPTPDPARPQKRKRREGPQDRKELGGTREATTGGAVAETS